MKHNHRRDAGPKIRLTPKSLQQLKDEGYRFALIKDYLVDIHGRRVDLNHFTIEPVNRLPTERAKMEIFAPIDSEILLAWANSAGEGIEAFILVGQESTV
jgi:hypothetical protein